MAQQALHNVENRSYKNPLVQFCYGSAFLDTTSAISKDPSLFMLFLDEVVQACLQANLNAKYLPDLERLREKISRETSSQK